MQDEKIVVFELDVMGTDDSSGGDTAPTRGWSKEKIIGSIIAKPSEIAADQLQRNMKQFLNNIHKMIAESSQSSGEYELDTVEVTASVSGKGQIGIIGFSLGLKGNGGITFTFKRRRS